MKNQLDLIFQNDVAYVDSRVIAKYYKKAHKHVIRDIEVMFERLNNSEFGGPNLGHEKYLSSYIDRGRTYKCYHLDFDLTLTLVTGYDVNLRYQLIKDWERKSFSRNDMRKKGIDDRKIFTDILQAHGITGWQFAAITNNMKKSLDIDLSIKRKDMDFEQLKKTRAAEALADVMLGDEDGYSEVNPVCVEAAETVDILSHRKIAS